MTVTMFITNSAPTRFYFNLRVTGVSGNTTAVIASRFLWLDNGLNFKMNRLQLYNQSGDLLKNSPNNHLLYGIKKVCTYNADFQRYWNGFSKKTRSWDSGAQP